MKDLLSATEIQKQRHQKNASVRVYDTISSTNQAAKEWAKQDAVEGDLIVAAHQTAGKGRLGKNFFSPEGSGLYFSLILRPSLSPDVVLQITTAAAVAVCHAIESLTEQTTAIKWVNDIFVGGKKVCGILSEASFSPDTGRADYVILGIGLNLYSPKNGFPSELQTIAGSLCSTEKCGLKNRLVANIVNRFFSIYQALPSTDYLQDYDQRMLLKGRRITYYQNDLSYSAKVLGIDSDGRLKVQNDAGEITYLSSGEVTIGSQTV